ncbi:MAG: MBOAT family protein [Campylobacterota bacterium]|nr:MBOAT family protein [Campylobacterota bacterium]
MLFNSYEFIFIFLPLSFFIYFFLLQKRLLLGAKSFLVFASLFFYAWWNISYLPIILASMLFNYVVGNSLNGNFTHQKVSKRNLLGIGIISNLLLLGYFKYSDFLIENFNVAFDTSHSLLHLMLPLAISFFTFQQIAYLVDSYRQETKEYDFINYALFVTFFPQLIAGPIVHHKEMMPQFASRWNMVKKYKNIALGIFIFSIGLFKKVVIADTFALWATTGFDHTSVLGFYEAWATSLSYTFQLYFDFSGYTDMAIGAALLFNIKLPINFFSPYKALTIQDFWRRWHITLSRFLKDYIYIPLGGNRKGNIRTYTNLITTFILGGLWHGAGWTFLFWGLLHGLALAIHRFWKNLGFKMPTILAWFITFQFINVAWVFFRAKEWEDAIKVLKGMTDIESLKALTPFKHIDTERVLTLSTFVEFNILYYTTSLLVLGFVISIFLPNTHQLRKKFQHKKEASLLDVLFIGVLLGLALIVTVASTGSEFLYFNF